MKFRRATFIAELLAVIATLLAAAIPVSAQSGTDEPIERLGLDIRGIESSKLGASATPAAKPENRPKGPTEITAHEATFDNSRHLATFNTEVLVRDPEFGLSCERLTVNLKKPPVPGAEKVDVKSKAPGESSSGIERATAEGSVIITQDKPDPATGKLQRYTGKAKRAVFDNTTGTLTLYGWPQISQTIGGTLSKQILSREESCVITLNRSGKIDVKGYHTSTLQDAADLSPSPSPR